MVAAVVRHRKVAPISWPGGPLALPTAKTTAMHAADREAAEERLWRSPTRRADEASGSPRAHTHRIVNGTAIGNGVAVRRMDPAVAVDGKSIAIETGITSVSEVAEVTRGLLR